MNVVASAPEGLEKYLAEEISNLGGFNINTYKRFINFECDFETFYRVHFYSRLAFRFYREIASLIAMTSNLYMRGLEIHLIG